MTKTTTHDNSACDQGNFHEHVQLIVQMDGLSIHEARLRAWMEGPTGYANRVAEMEDFD